jgi:hypothetical protein
MKILLLSVYLLGASLYQQDAAPTSSPTSARRPENSGAQQPRRKVVQTSPFSARYEDAPADKKSVRKSEQPANATSSPAASSLPKK